MLLILAVFYMSRGRIAIEGTPEQRAAAIKKPDISFSPLAMPMLAGGGSIAAIVAMTREA